MKIIRKTKSVCPVCITDLDADIIEEKNKIYMTKNCNKHGSFKILICEDSSFYKQLNGMYLNLYSNKKSKTLKYVYNLYLTFNCNMNCPICYTNANSTDYKEPNLGYIWDVIKGWKNIRIALFGGEPTIRKDLPEIIKCVEKTGNFPMLLTNGIKFTNLDYLKKINNKRLIVLLQFDGFRDDIYKKLRAEKLVKKKKQILQNLKKLNIPTGLEVTVARNINEGELEVILNFAVRNEFIKQICYRGYGYIGKKRLNKDYMITGNSLSLINILQKQTNGKIAQKDILNFQKLIYFLKKNFDFLPIYPCLNVYLYLIYRKRNSYVPISKLISLDIIQKDIDRYFHLVGQGHNIKSFILANKILFKVLATSKILVLSKIILPIIAQSLFGERCTLKDIQKDWLLLRFSILCEPSTFDYTIASNCNSGEINTDTGVTPHRGICNILREKEVVKTK